MLTTYGCNLDSEYYSTTLRELIAPKLNRAAKLNQCIYSYLCYVLSDLGYIVIHNKLLYHKLTIGGTVHTLTSTYTRTSMITHHHELTQPTNTDEGGPNLSTIKYNFRNHKGDLHVFQFRTKCQPKLAGYSPYTDIIHHIPSNPTTLWVFKPKVRLKIEILTAPTIYTIVAIFLYCANFNQNRLKKYFHPLIDLVKPLF